VLIMSPVFTRNKRPAFHLLEIWKHRILAALDY